MRIWLAGILLLIHQAISNTCNVKQWEQTCPLIRYKFYQKYYYDVSLKEEELIVEDVPTLYQHSELSDEDFEKYALTVALPIDSDHIQFTLEHDTYGQLRCPNDFEMERSDPNIVKIEDQWCLCYEDMFENEEERFEMYSNLSFTGRRYFCGRSYSMLCLRNNNYYDWTYWLNAAIGLRQHYGFGGNSTTPFAYHASRNPKHISGGHTFHPFAIYELVDEPKWAILNMTVFSKDDPNLKVNYGASIRFPAPKRRFVKDDITGETLMTIRVMPMRYRTSRKEKAYEFHKGCLVKWHFPHAILHYRYDTLPPPTSKVKPSVSAERFHAAESFRPQKRVEPKVLKSSLTTTTTSSSASRVFPVLAILFSFTFRTPWIRFIAPLMLAQPVAVAWTVTFGPSSSTTPRTTFHTLYLKPSAYMYDYSNEGSTFLIRQKYTGFSLNSVTKHEFDQHSATLILPENGTVSLKMGHEGHNAENDICRTWDYDMDHINQKIEHQSCLCYEDNLISENERFNMNITSSKDTVYFCGHGFSMICIREFYYVFNAAISPLRGRQLRDLYNDTMKPVIFVRGKKTDQDFFTFKFNATQKDEKLIKLGFSTAYDRNNGHITTTRDVFETEINVPAPKIREMIDPRTGRVVKTIRVLPVQYQYPRTCEEADCPVQQNLRCYVTWRFENCRLYHLKQPDGTTSINGIGSKDVKQFQVRDATPRDVVLPEVVIVDEEDKDEESGAPGSAERAVLVILMFLCTYLIPLY